MSREHPPPGLALVQGFINTTELDEDYDHIADRDGLRKWLAEKDLIGAREQVTAADVERAIEVREGLRSLLFENNGGGADPEKVARLERAAARAGLRTSFAPGRDPELAPGADGVDGALGRLLANVAIAAQDGSWCRLKACADEDCAWAFWDQSKNRSARWCSMATCGNRHKARSYRERRAEASPEPA